MNKEENLIVGIIISACIISMGVAVIVAHFYSIVPALGSVLITAPISMALLARLAR